MAKPSRRAQRKESSVISFNDSIKVKAREIQLVPKSVNQEKYILNLLNNQQDIVIAHGPAGCGKTFLAMQAAIRSLRNGTCERIVLTRPAVGVEEESHGFLPGTLEEKMAPWTRPLLDVMREYYAPPEITRMLENQIVEIAPLTFMRGRTFSKAWIIADEMQSSTANQMKMLLTRIGEDSKIVITGDQEQTERRFEESNGLKDLINRLTKYQVKGMVTCGLNKSDICRHKIIDEVIALYDK